MLGPYRTPGYAQLRALRTTSDLRIASYILTRLHNAAFLGAVIAVVIAAFVVGALVGPLANATTGITIAHTGFTPNPNVTQSPGATPLLQLYPLFFVILGLVIIARYASEHTDAF